MKEQQSVRMFSQSKSHGDQLQPVIVQMTRDWLFSTRSLVIKDTVLDTLNLSKLFRYKRHYIKYVCSQKGYLAIKDIILNSFVLRNLFNYKRHYSKYVCSLQVV